MLKITLVNAKGGCGKTTIATNLASYFAGEGLQTTLMDYDPQGSSQRWLELRDDTLPAIRGIDAVHRKAGVTRSWQLHAGQDTEVLVMDTPAGIGGSQLVELLRQADTVLVPVMPSVIDMQATADFIQNLLRVANSGALSKQVGIIANRLHANARSRQVLEEFLAGYDIPVVARLRDTQNYVNAMEAGCGIHELRSSLTVADRRQWSSFIKWLHHDGCETISVPENIPNTLSSLGGNAVG